MRRTRFLEFAQLPLEIQVTILEYVHSRGDPSKLSSLNYRHQNILKENLKRWGELRTVCRQWSQWFSLSSVRNFLGKPVKLGGNALLERMTSLTYLDILEDRLGQKEDLQRVKLMLPSSLLYLDNCPIELLQRLPRKCVSSLETVNIVCRASEPGNIRLFRKFNGRIARLHLYDSQEQIIKWLNLISELDLEELKIIFVGSADGPSSDDLPALPETLESLDIYGASEVKSTWLPPHLESISALDGNLEISMALPNIKEISAQEICFPGVNLLSDTFRLASLLPNLEMMDSISFPACCSSIFRGLSSLRSLNLNLDEDDSSFNLADLPQSLEELTLNKEIFGVIHGQPPLMPQLLYLTIYVRHLDLYKGTFNSMPSLEDLSLTTYGDEPFDLKELLPLCNNLIALHFHAGWRWNNNDRGNVFYHLTRLKKLTLDCQEEYQFELGLFPKSLEELEISGNFLEGSPIGELPNLNSLEFRTENEAPVQIAINIFRNAPLLQRAILFLLENELAQKFLEGLAKDAFEKLAHLEIVTYAPFNYRISNLLKSFPNVNVVNNGDVCHIVKAVKDLSV